MVKSNYDKYVDIVNNFVDSNHYSILIEVDDGERTKSLRNRLIQEFGYKNLLIRKRKNFVHIEKMVV